MVTLRNEKPPTRSPMSWERAGGQEQRMTESKMVPVHGWDLHVGQDAEPRVRDLDLGARLGYERASDFRALVKRLANSGILNDIDYIGVARRIELNPGRGSFRDVIEYHLTEVGALVAISRSDTAMATLITRQVIETFLAYRANAHRAAEERLMAMAREQEERLASMSRQLEQSNARIGDGALHRMSAKAHCLAVAKAIGVSLLRVYGVLRREFKVPSMYLIRLGEWDRFLGTLELLKRECRLKSGRVPLRLRDNQGELDFDVAERVKLAS